MGDNAHWPVNDHRLPCNDGDDGEDGGGGDGDSGGGGSGDGGGMRTREGGGKIWRSK